MILTWYSLVHKYLNQRKLLKEEWLANPSNSLAECDMGSNHKSKDEERITV